MSMNILPLGILAQFMKNNNGGGSNNITLPLSYEDENEITSVPLKKVASGTSANPDR